MQFAAGSLAGRHAAPGIRRLQASPIHEWIGGSHVADFIAEVLGGPEDYSEKGGGHAHMASRLAIINSQLPVGTSTAESTPMPKWSWGVPGGPYAPDDSGTQET